MREEVTVVKTLRALLVEDSPDDAALIILELRRAGFDPRTERVATAHDFRAALQREPWDVVLSDCSMPQFNGKAALEILNAWAVDTPFIIVSGSMGEDVAVQLMKAGARDFLPKGNMAEIGPTIERELREAGLRRQRMADVRRAEDERERLLAELREALRARDTFLSIASHELRPLLTSLEFQIERLQRRGTVPAESLRTWMSGIGRRVRRLTTLVDNLLDVGHITSGRMVLALEEADLGEIVSDVVGDSEDLIRKSSSALSLKVESIIGQWDRVRIETVITNLLANALKFGSSKPVHVALCRAGARARLMVADEGIGISTERQSSLFEKYDRAVSRTNFGGFGLGLWIVREVVQAHGGVIRVDSREGAGATFIVELPIHAPLGALPFG